MEADELRTRIAAFPRWNQRFEFENGVVTPIGDRSLINRQQQRYAYFFERLLAATGGRCAGVASSISAVTPASGRLRRMRPAPTSCSAWI